MAREQNKLAAILAAEVVGYSCLMGRDERDTRKAKGPSSGSGRPSECQHRLRPLPLHAAQIRADDMAEVSGRFVADVVREVSPYQTTTSAPLIASPVSHASSPASYGGPIATTPSSISVP